MALSYGQHQIGMKRTGQHTTIDDNDIAKLMYYLHCVCTTIECNDEPEIQRFTKYSNCPDIFNDKVFFHSDALCTDASNEFYEISQVSSHLVAARSIVIAERTRRVNKIMAYKLSWMQRYYFEPMQRQAQRFCSKKKSRCVIS